MQNKIVKTDLVRVALLTNINNDVEALYTAVDNRALLSHTHGAGGTVSFSTGPNADRLLYAPTNDLLWYEDDTKSFYFYDFSTLTWILYDTGFFSNTGLGILDSNGTHYLTMKVGSNLLAARTLTLTTGDSDRTITLNGNPTLNDWFDQSLKVASSPTFADMTIADATGITFNNTGLHILDSNGTHDLIIKPGSNLTADRTLTFTTGDASRTITLNGNPTLNDWFDQSVKTTSSPTFVNVIVDNATGITFNNTGLHILDINATHDLILKPGSDLTADKTLTFTTGDSDRTVTLNGNPTLSDWFDQEIKEASSPTFNGLTLTSLIMDEALTATIAEINKACDGITATAAEINGACDLSSNNFFGTGRKVLFYENVAPTGWTIQTTLNDKLVFITKGSAAGGQTGGAAHSAGTWTQPNHTHTGPSHTHTGPSHAHSVPSGGMSYRAGSDSNWCMNKQQGTADHLYGIVTGAGGTGATGAGGTGNTGSKATTSAWRPAAYSMIIASLD